MQAAAPGPQHRAPPPPPSTSVLWSWDHHPFFPMKLEPGLWELSEGLWRGLTIIPALAPTGNPCPGRLCTPSGLPGPCWAAGRQSLARPA